MGWYPSVFNLRDGADDPIEANHLSTAMIGTWLDGLRQAPKRFDM
jgi:hypothetical protein